MRLLFASSQGTGHYTPLLPFVEAARRHGHDVVLVVPPALQATVEAAGYPHRIGADPPPELLGPVWGRVAASSRMEGETLVLREIFGNLNAAAMLPAMRAACEELAPDAVLRECAEFSSALAADELGIPHARIAIGLATTEKLALPLWAPAVDARRPGLSQRIGRSPYLTTFPASFDRSPFDDTRRFGEPAAAPGGDLPDWWDGADAPLVYVTFGSVAGALPIGPVAYRAALEAVDGLEARVLLTIGRGADEDALGPLPRNVHVERWVPQEDVLAHAAAIVGHGGSGTTLGALAAGVPQVVVPLFADQPFNAERVAEAGAGLAVDNDDWTQSAMRTLTGGGRRGDPPRARGRCSATPPTAPRRRAWRPRCERCRRSSVPSTRSSEPSRHDRHLVLPPGLAPAGREQAAVRRRPVGLVEQPRRAARPARRQLPRQIGHARLAPPGVPDRNAARPFAPEQRRERRLRIAEAEAAEPVHAPQHGRLALPRRARRAALAGRDQGRGRGVVAFAARALGIACEQHDVALGREAEPAVELDGGVVVDQHLERDRRQAEVARPLQQTLAQRPAEPGPAPLGDDAEAADPAARPAPRERAHRERHAVLEERERGAGVDVVALDVRGQRRGVEAHLDQVALVGAVDERDLGVGVERRERAQVHARTALTSTISRPSSSSSPSR